ncbi:MAG: prepilin peptidase [Candidatus Pacebacteria bacterium]|nr:prepilin peptidase [Candidatus Paceibacterota bacterium]
MMLEFILIFIIGLFIGSFLNCIVYRVYNNKSFIKGHSFCPNCKHKLGVLDLIPLFSYLSLRGKCRYCSQKISPQYPIVEILTGLVFLFVAFMLNVNFFTLGVFNLEFLNLLFYLFIASYFIMIFIFDCKWYIIPDGLTFSAIIITLIYLFSQTFILNVITPEQLLFTVISTFITFLFFFALYFFSEGKAMGFGDVKLVIFLGLILGFPKILPALFIAFGTGAIVGLIMMALKKKGIKSEIPFGPFLVLGTFIALFFGNHLVDWYLGLM